ncbi:MAG: energy-coupling factor transporter ATPase [Clostridia bacterium]|nr:energy-coupling factor transporter ATPase [Clostridia bacterium]
MTEISTVQNENIIELENVSYIYGKGTPFEKKALDSFSAKLERGTVTGIIGHTGSGKSTLVQMLNGLIKPSEGTVRFCGRDIWEDPKKLRELRFKIGLVFQYPEYQLFEESVRKDIEFGPRNMGLSEEEIKKRVLKAASFSDIDISLLDKSPFDLSGGQKRRCAIAGVMAMEPEVLILDEPAAGLDPYGRSEIFNGIVSYRNETDSTVIIVSHSMEDIAKYCDRILVVSDGKKIQYGTREQIFAHPDTLCSIGLDIPRITKLVSILCDRGIDIPRDIFTVERAVNELLPLLSGKERADD